MKKIFQSVFVFFTGLLLTGVAFAAEPEPSASAAAPAAAKTEMKVWLDDQLPADAKMEGTWNWEEAAGASGKVHAHPSAKGMNSHGFTSSQATKLTNDQMVTQQVWLDPNDAPKGIMLKFKLSDGKEVGVYWEGEEEVFTPAEDEEVWYYGLLPQLGQWTNLEVLAEDLGLEDQEITGVTFVTFDGRALWDKLSIAQAPPLEEPEDLPVPGEETPKTGAGASKTE